MATNENQLDPCMAFEDFYSGLASEPAAAAEMAKIRNFDCKCQRKRHNKENSGQQTSFNASCSQNLDPAVIMETRREMAALPRDHRDMVLLAIITTCMNDSEMTRCTKKVERRFDRSTYKVNSVVVCRDTLCFVYG